MERSAILVIRPDDDFSESLRQNGFEVLNLELIKTEPLNDLSELDEVIERINEYDGIFLTSPVAAKIFALHFGDSGRSYSGKVYTLGPRAKEALSGLEFENAFSDTANTADELLDGFGESEFEGKNLLFIRGDHSVGSIKQKLNGKANLNEVVVYRTIESRPDEKLLNVVKKRFAENEIGWVCFFSPSGVSGFSKVFGNEDLVKVKGAAIGSTTADRAGELGIRVDFISQRATAEGFSAGLAEYLKSIE